MLKPSYKFKLVKIEDKYLVISEDASMRIY